MSSGNHTNYFITITLNILIHSDFAGENVIQHTPSGRETGMLPGGSNFLMSTARSAQGTLPTPQGTKTTPILVSCLELHIKGAFDKVLATLTRAED